MGIHKFTPEGDVRVYLSPAVIVYQILPHLIQQLYLKSEVHPFEPKQCPGCAEKCRSIRSLYYGLLDAGVEFDPEAESTKILKEIIHGKLPEWPAPEGEEWKREQ